VFNLPAPPGQGYPQYLKDMATGAIGDGPTPEELGQELFNEIFKDKVGQKFHACCAVAKNRGASVRIALSILSSDLISVPWEFLNDGTSFLLKKGFSIVRVIDELPEELAPFRPFQRPLIVIANPGNRFDAVQHKEQLNDIMKQMGINEPIYAMPATRESLEEKIRNNEFDLLYFLGHGRFDPSSGGQLLLEKDNGSADPLGAETLASWLRSKVDLQFAYLNSCSTGSTQSRNTFAGVAQRLMLDGGVTAVVAMQAQVEANAAMAMAKSFFETIRQGRDPEQGMVDGRKIPQDPVTWGIPVIYTHIAGPEEFERNRIACLLDAKIGQSTYSLSFATFRMGVPAEKIERNEVSVRIEPENAYSYRGHSFARTDIMCAHYILELLAQITDLRNVKILAAHERQGKNITHRFLFGSKSHKLVQSLLEAYKPHFAIHYKHKEFPGKWVLEDTHYRKAYTIIDPSTLRPYEFEKLNDFGIIEKIVDPQLGRVLFIIAGLGDRATEGCGWYLLRHWDEILSKHVTGRFEIILKFPGGLGFEYGREIDRKQNDDAVDFAGS